MTISSTIARSHPAARCARANHCRFRRMPRKPVFRLGRSRTGLGLFATAPIKKRAFIVEYKGRKLTTEQADVLEARGNRYLYEINSRWTIDGTTRRNSGPLRQSFVPAERQGPHGRPQGLPARHQEHQAGRRDHLQLWPRLFPQRHHATRLQMRQVPGETRRGPGQDAGEDAGEVTREGRSQGESRKASDLGAGFSRGEARRDVVPRSVAMPGNSTADSGKRGVCRLSHQRSFSHGET